MALLLNLASSILINTFERGSYTTLTYAVDLNNWVALVISTFCHFQKEEIYWPEVGTTLSYEKIKIDAKQQEDIGKHTVVTMDLRDEKSVCTHSLLYLPKGRVSRRKR